VNAVDRNMAAALTDPAVAALSLAPVELIEVAEAPFRKMIRPGLRADGTGSLTSTAATNKHSTNLQLPLRWHSGTEVAVPDPGDR
jgi:hypothetical protein